MPQVTGRQPLAEDRRAWQQQPYEPDGAYNAFCEYLKLAKRGQHTADGRQRRFLSDLTLKIGHGEQQLAHWCKVWSWRDRAEAYDSYLTTDVLATAEMEERRRLAMELRSDGLALRGKARRYLEGLEEITSAEEAIRVYKLGLQLAKEAESLDGPLVAKKRELLVEEVRDRLSQLLGGKHVHGGARRVLSAVERTLSVELDPEADPGELRALPELPAAVCGEDSEAEVDSGPGADREGGIES
jgi:hypothetical protein